jgi:predicted O-methyltransferase YrrM
MADSKFKRRLGFIRQRLLGSYPGFPILRPTDTCGVEVLADPAFQRSCREIKDLTLLDTPRLANLWSLCRMTNPRGHIIEVGSFKGGGALHLSNSCPERKVIACDSFAGFEQLDAKLDHNFSEEMFKNTKKARVEELFHSRGRPYLVIAGFFPASCAGMDPGPISFAHLDADLYKSTSESLEYLAGRLIDRSLIVLDDYFRRADGVNQAVREFTQKHKSWAAFPLYPGQGLLVHRSWFGD